MTIAISIALLTARSVSNMLLLDILQSKKRDILNAAVHPGTVDELSAVSEFTAKIQIHLLCAWLAQRESPDLLVHE